MLRLATDNDLPILTVFAKKFHEASPYRDLGFDAEKVATMILNLIEAETGLVLVMGEEPQGTLIATASETLFGRDLQATELMFWVEPEHRGKEGMQLAGAYEYWATKIGCKPLTLSSLEGEFAEPLDRAYKNMGFLPCEHSYMKVL